MMHRFFSFLLLCFLAAAVCGCRKPLDAAALRGLPKEQIESMLQEILSRHADGSALSKRETADAELLREQLRRLENAWIFGEWRERHGTRLIFRDDGTVSVGARGGVYDEWGVYKFISPERPSYESHWSVFYDQAGDPVVLIAAKPGGSAFLYPFHGSRNSVHEQEGDLSASSETGFFFTRIQQ